MQNKVDWSALEHELALTNDFEERLKLYADYAGLVKAGGRLYTQDAEGRENIKVFCLCDNCRKADPVFEEHYAIYQGYLQPELSAVAKYLHSLTNYKDKLAYYDQYFDRYGTYEFPESGLKFSVLPQNEQERIIYNQGTYQSVLDRYFLQPSAIPQYFQNDFNYRSGVFNRQLAKALYPDELRQKEIERIKLHYHTQASVLAAKIFTDLIDGMPLDDGAETWDWNHAVAVVDAHEAYLFLKYMENPKKKLHQAIQEYIRQGGPYPVISWQMINDTLAEIKTKLFELSNTDSRTAYLKTALISLKIKGFEDMFKEAEEFVGEDFNINSSSEGNLAVITDPVKDIPFHAGLYSIVHGRNYIIIELSEHVLTIYPDIDFDAVMKAADYRTPSTFWISAGKPVLPLNNREKAKLYLYKTELGLETHLSTAEFKIKYPGKNLEMARNDIQSGRKPATKPELQHILAYLETTNKFLEIQTQIKQDMQSLNLN